MYNIDKTTSNHINENVLKVLGEHHQNLKISDLIIRQLVKLWL